MSQNNIFNRVSYKKLDASKIKLENLLEKDDDDGKTQLAGYCRYEDKQLVVQCPPTRIDWGGIPRKEDKIYTTTYDQSKNVQIGLRVNPETNDETDEQREKRQAKLDELEKMVDSIDEFMQSDEAKIQMFGSVKKAKKYIYSPIKKVVKPKEPDSDSDDEDDKKPKKVYFKPSCFFKTRVPFEWDKEKSRFTEKVKTSVILINDDESSEHYQNDGKYSPVDDVTDLDSLRKYVRYMSTVRYQLHLAKVWANKTPTSINGKSGKLYGVILKINRVLIERSKMASRSTENSGPDVYDVPSSDDEEEDNMVKNVLQSNNDDEEETQVVDDEDEENNDDEENDSSSEEKPAPKKTTGRRGRRGRSSA